MKLLPSLFRRPSTLLIAMLLFCAAAHTNFAQEQQLPAVDDNPIPAKQEAAQQFDPSQDQDDTAVFPGEQKKEPPKEDKNQPKAPPPAEQKPGQPQPPPEQQPDLNGENGGVPEVIEPEVPPNGNNILPPALPNPQQGGGQQPGQQPPRPVEPEPPLPGQEPVPFVPRPANEQPMHQFDIMAANDGPGPDKPNLLAAEAERQAPAELKHKKAEYEENDSTTTTPSTPSTEESTTTETPSPSSETTEFNTTEATQSTAATGTDTMASGETTPATAAPWTGTGPPPPPPTEETPPPVQPSGPTVGPPPTPQAQTQEKIEPWKRPKRLGGLIASIVFLVLICALLTWEKCCRR